MEVDIPSERAAKQFTEIRATTLVFPTNSGPGAGERKVVATTRPSIVTRSGQWSKLTIPVSLLMPSDVEAATRGRSSPSLAGAIWPSAERQTERASRPARLPCTTSLSEKRNNEPPLRTRQPEEASTTNHA